MSEVRDAFLAIAAEVEDRNVNDIMLEDWLPWLHMHSAGGCTVPLSADEKATGCVVDNKLEEQMFAGTNVEDTGPTTGHVVPPVGHDKPTTGHVLPCVGHDGPTTGHDTAPVGHDSSTTGHGVPSVGHGSSIAGHGMQLVDFVAAPVDDTPQAEGDASQANDHKHSLPQTSKYNVSVATSLAVAVC